MPIRSRQLSRFRTLVLLSPLALVACNKGPAVRSLKEQLDMLPAGVEKFAVVRDLRPVMAEVRSLESVFSTLKRELPGALREVSDITKTSEADTQSLEEALGTAASALASLSAAKIDATKGLIAGELGSETFLFIGAEGLEPLRELAVALEKDPQEVDRDCAPLSDHTGWVACSSAGSEAAAKLEPAKDGAAKLEQLKGIGADTATSLALYRDPQAGPSFVSTLSFVDGLWHLTVQGSTDLDQARDVLVPGPASALRDVVPGSGAYWARINVNALRSKYAAAIPGLVSGLVNSLTGELMFGSTLGSPLVLRAGVTDPAPVAGMIMLGVPFLQEWASSPLLSLAGASVTVEQKQASSGDKSTTFLYVKATGNATQAWQAAGHRPEATAFAAGGYATVAFGSGTEFVEQQLAANAMQPSAEWLEQVPAPLAADLGASRVAALMMLPFDAIHQTDLTKVTEQDLTAEQQAALQRLAALISRVLSPYVSAAGWVNMVDDQATLSLTLQTIGATDDDEGKAVRAVLEKGFAGEDTRAAFAELANKYDRSRLAAFYRARGDAAPPPQGVPLASLVGTAAAGGVAIALLGQSGEIWKQLAEQATAP